MGEVKFRSGDPDTGEFSPRVNALIAEGRRKQAEKENQEQVALSNIASRLFVRLASDIASEVQGYLLEGHGDYDSPEFPEMIKTIRALVAEKLTG